MKWFNKNIKTDDILKKIESKYRVRRYIELIIGVLIISISFNIFLYPNDIVFGGVSGLSIIVKEIFPVDPSKFIMICSLLLLLVSFVVLGKEKTKGSVVGSLLFPIFVDLTANINNYLQIDNSNLLLSVLFAGVIYGFGAGLVFKAGFTTGGTDIINQIISKYCHVSIGNAMLMSDGLIVLLGTFFFGVNKLMYAIIVIYIIGLITDKVLLGISNSKAFYIITNEDKQIRNYILNELHHGVTIFNVRGGYTMEKDEVILCVVPTREYYRLKEGIHEIDPNAFFVVTDAYEVMGGE